MAFDLKGRKYLAQGPEIARAQWSFVWRALLLWIGEPTACEIEQGIVAPGFAEDGEAAGFEDAGQFACRARQMQVVQDRIAPDAIKGGVREGELFGIGLHEIDRYTVGDGPAACFFEITGRQIDARDNGPAPRKTTAAMPWPQP